MAQAHEANESREVIYSMKELPARRLIINAVAMAIGLAVSVAAVAQTMARNQYKSARSGLTAEHKSAAAACGSLSGHAKDICRVEASGNEKVAKAELRARYKPSDNASYKVRIARADADYSVAAEKCNAKAGNGKDLCVKQATAAAGAARDDAMAKMKTADSGETAHEKTAKAKNGADGKIAKTQSKAS